MKLSRLIILSICLFLIVTFSFGFPFSPSALASSSGSEVLALVNKERIASGNTELVWNDKLAKAAEMKATDMFQNNYWAHFSPSGTSPWEFFAKANYEFTHAGENLARGFPSSADAVTAWMNSASHKANIVSKKYRETGVAVAKGKINGVETEIIVQLFGTSKTAIF